MYSRDDGTKKKKNPSSVEIVLFGWWTRMMASSTMIAGMRFRNRIISFSSPSASIHPLLSLADTSKKFRRCESFSPPTYCLFSRQILGDNNSFMVTIITRKSDHCLFGKYEVDDDGHGMCALDQFDTCLGSLNNNTHGHSLYHTKKQFHKETTSTKNILIGRFHNNDAPTIIHCSAL